MRRDMLQRMGVSLEDYDRSRKQAQAHDHAHHGHDHDHDHDHEQAAPAANPQFPQLPDAFFQESAERRVRVGLVLAEIIRTRQLQPDDEKVRAMIRRLASAYNDPESVARYYYSNEEQLAQVEQAVLEEQVVELVVSESGVTEVAASYDELIAPRPNPGAVS
jgi:FKBP-type peptidyl-prolyl cis-trans isomerase (trigger factor)